MQTRIPVFKTYVDSYKTISQNFELFKRGLMLPFILCVLMGVVLIYLNCYILSPTPTDLKPHLLTLAVLVVPLIFTCNLMFNIVARITITGTIGHRGWKMTETKSMLRLLAIGLVAVLAILPVIIVFSIFYGSMMVISESTFAFMTKWEPFISLAQMAVTYMMLFYILCRLLPVMPATAIGKKIKLREAWKLSKGNGWRLIIIAYLPTILYSLCVSASMLFFKNAFYIQTLLFPMSMCAQIITMTSIAMAYKKLTAE